MGFVDNKEACVHHTDQTPVGRVPVFFIAFGTLALLITSGCGSPNFSGSNPAAPVPLKNNLTSTAVPVLLYNGTGTSATDVSAVESVLSTLNLKYSTANTSQLQAMTELKLA